MLKRAEDKGDGMNEVILSLVLTIMLIWIYVLTLEIWGLKRNLKRFEK